MANIGILGVGSWSIGIASILADNNHSITMYGRDNNQVAQMSETGRNPKYFSDFALKGNIKYTNNIQEAFDNADFIINVIPTQSIRDALKSKPEIGADTVIVNASKGIETGSMKLISDIFQEHYPNNHFATLSGPSHAEEVIKKMPTTLVSACEDIKVAQAVQDVFMNEYIRVYSNTDILGVEISGALKNVIAICAGFCKGIGFGDNTIAAIITRGNVEIKRLGIAMGAQAHTFDGLSGIGDLIVTCVSEHSRNNRFGQLLGKGICIEDAKAEIGMVVEGIFTADAAYALSKKYNVEMPMVSTLYGVMYKGIKPDEAVALLMQREKKHEIEVLD